MAAAPTSADSPTPTPTPRSLGALAYGVDGDIYVADWDGANAVRIADGRPPNECGGLGEYWGEGPIWSPDGRYLAYRHTDCQAGPPLSRDPWWDVVITDRQGNIVASFPSEGWQIMWSPDSTRVAVWVRFGDTIGVYGLNGKRQTTLIVPPGTTLAGDFDPVWSADGESLLLPSVDVSEAAQELRGVEVPLDGRTPRRLPSSDPRSQWNATYSPDGSRVAYTVGALVGSLVVADADGSHAREVVAGHAHNPVWSPSGDRIAFAYGNWHSTEIRVIDLATETVTLLADMDRSELLGVIDFSPDGDQILFSRTEDNGRGVSSLWSIRADGSDPRHLVTGTGWGDWRPPSPTR